MPGPGLLLAGQELAVLPELLILAGCAIAAVLILRIIRLPVIAGMLVAGALAGPHGLHLVSHSEHLTAFSEIGVALLLFTIGLEFNRERIASTGSRAIIAGICQVLLTILAAGGVALVLGMSLTQSIYIGLIISLSSTAIVLRALTERAELSAPHGRLILGTLIIQDLAIVPMLIVVPMLGGGGGNVALNLGAVVFKAALLIVLALVAARYVLPHLMRAIAAVSSRDIFLLAALSIALGLAWLSQLAGLSPALGAFIAGIMLANSEYAHHTLSEVLPVRELFFSFFFITMGMLFDWRLVAAYPLQVIGVLAALLLGKGLIAGFAVLLLRFPARIALLFGLGLAQFGEFGYLLLQAGKSPPLESSLLSVDTSAILLAAGLISMFLTPLILAFSPHLSAGMALLRPMEKLLRVRGIDDPDECHSCLNGHVILAGLGPAGRMLLAALQAAAVPFLVLEMNSETVRRFRAKGVPVYYGDITSREALEHASLATAAAVIISFRDRSTVARAIAVINRLAPHVDLIVRAPFASQIAPLQQQGVTAVVVDELAAGKVLTEEVMSHLAKTGAGQAGPTD
ncbi:cation:proton antiporter [bacterium]|nr:cation:proton antiporter [bacterium]